MNPKTLGLGVIIVVLLGGVRVKQQTKSLLQWETKSLKTWSL